MKTKIFSVVGFVCCLMILAGGVSYGQISPVQEELFTVKFSFEGSTDEAVSSEFPGLKAISAHRGKGDSLGSVQPVRCKGDGCTQGLKTEYPLSPPNGDNQPVTGKVGVVLARPADEIYDGVAVLTGYPGMTFTSNNIPFTIYQGATEPSPAVLSGIYVQGCVFPDPDPKPTEFYWRDVTATVTLTGRTTGRRGTGSDTEYIAHKNTTRGPAKDKCACKECTDKLTKIAKGCSSPVYAGSGDMVQSYTDIYIPDIGIPLEITRTYHSQNNDNPDWGNFKSSFGWGWSSSLATVKLFSSDPYDGPSSPYILIAFSNGKRLRFYKTTLTGKPYTAAVYEVLRDNGGGSYTLNPQCSGCGSGTAELEYNFNNSGQLTSIKDANGNSQSFAYDGSGKLTTVISPSGRTLTLNYNAADRISSIIVNSNGQNRTYTYGYDANGNLATVTDYLGKTTFTYTYDDWHNLTSVTDVDNKTVLSAAYDNIDRAISVTEDGVTHTYSYPDPDNMTGTTIVTDSLGRTTRYTFANYGPITNVAYPDGSFSADSVESSTANVNSSTDARGNTTSYTFNSKGYVIKETNSLGDITEYTYSSIYSNKPLTETDAAGRVTSYDYDSDGNLIWQRNALLDTTLYSYDAKGQLLRTTDERGNITRYTYDAYGNQTSITDDLDNLVQYEYDTWGNRTKMTDARGKVTCYDYDALNRLTRKIRNVGDALCTVDADDVVTSYGYDAVGNRIRETDPEGNLTCYEYDANNRLIKETRNVGDVVCSADADDVVTQYTYDAEGNKTSQTDAGGDVICYEYDSRNRLVKEIRNVGDAVCGIDADDVVTQYAYDTEGNRTTVTDPRGYAAAYTYDALNRQTQMTDALSYSEIYSYDKVGNRLKVTDANGKLTYYQYDVLNRQTKQIRKVGDTSPTPDGDDAVTSYTYDAAGNQTSVTDPNGNATTYTYDDLNRQLQMTNALTESEIYSYDQTGNQVKVTGSDGNVTINTYDDLNRLTNVSDSLGTVAVYTYDKNGNRLTETDPNGNTTGYTYDDLNRVIQATDPMGQNTVYEYDKLGNRTKFTDREGAITTYTYDDLSRLLVETKDPAGLNIATTYEYDKNGNRTKITDDNGNITAYTYDALNRLSQETYADTKTVTYTYDAAGNRLTRIDQNGDTTAYTYDDLHRLTLRNYPGSNDDSFTYDLGGRMVTADNAISSVRYNYDTINRTDWERQNGKTIDYAYNTSARTRQLTYPGARVILETRDKRQRLDTVKEGANTIADYNYSGNRLGTITYLNGAVATYSYNANNWITGLSHYKGITRISEFSHGFDNEGNRKYAERLHDSGNSEFYIYDKIYRLTTFKRGALNPGKTDIPVPVTQTAYNLDGVGNWNSKTTDAVTETRTHNAVNELTARDAVSLLYSDNGNLTDDNIYTYSYDYENRLTKVTRKSDSQIMAEFKYDALGRRIEKSDVVAVIVTKYYLDGDRVIEEQESGSTTATYVYGDWIDAVLTMTRSGSTYYYHPNTLGSIDALTDSTGATVEYYRYDAYGTATVLTGPGPDLTWFTADDATANKSALGNPYLFTGRQWDDEVGLYYYRARYYSPALGRFIQHDPLGYVDGLNLFEYVRGNPGNGVDIYGLFSDYGFTIDPNAYKYQKGSSNYSSESPTLIDYFNKIKWQELADNARLFTYVVAANHMDHYLKNTDTPMWLDFEKMISDETNLRKIIEDEMQSAALFVEDIGKNGKFKIYGKSKKGYHIPSNSKWFLAVGGFTIWGEADVNISGDADCYEMNFKLNFFDGYNWHNELAISFPIIGKVGDEALGRLHKVGLAKEFEIYGVSSVRYKSWTKKSQTFYYGSGVSREINSRRRNLKKGKP